MALGTFNCLLWVQCQPFIMEWKLLDSIYLYSSKVGTNWSTLKEKLENVNKCHCCDKVDDKSVL